MFQKRLIYHIRAFKFHFKRRKNDKVLGIILHLPVWKFIPSGAFSSILTLPFSTFRCHKKELSSKLCLKWKISSHIWAHPQKYWVALRMVPQLHDFVYNIKSDLCAKNIEKKYLNSTRNTSKKLQFLMVETLRVLGGSLMKNACLLPYEIVRWGEKELWYSLIYSKLMVK